MTHADDDGLVLPPLLAPVQVVILPIYKENSKQTVLEFCKTLKTELSQRTFRDEKLRVEIDDRDIRGGEKFWQWVKQGVPIRLEIGMRDIDNNVICVHRRNRPSKEKENISYPEFVKTAPNILENIHTDLFSRAEKYRTEHSNHVISKDELFDFFNQKDLGFAYAHWCGAHEIEEEMKSKFGVTIRCLPFSENEPGSCIFTGKPSQQKVIWAKSY
jgi:prolyl-tRNA synthetase